MKYTWQYIASFQQRLPKQTRDVMRAIYKQAKLITVAFFKALLRVLES